MEEVKILKVYTVIIDGIDKSGKDTIAKYVWPLDHRLNVFVRGWPSLVAYAKKFNRNCKYELPWKNVLYVYCKVDEEDWKIRCSINNEDMTNLDFKKDTELFDEAFNKLSENGFNVLTINTSRITAYDAAKMIVGKMQKLNYRR